MRGTSALSFWVFDHCGAGFGFTAVIEDPAVIEQILSHLGLRDWRLLSRAREEDHGWRMNGQISLTCEPVAAVACLISIN